MPNKQSAGEWLLIAKHDLMAAGEMKDFTGVSAPYEKPLTPDLTIDSVELQPVEAVLVIKQKLLKHQHRPV